MDTINENSTDPSSVAERLKQIGTRIREARTALNVTPAEMAALHHITEEEYIAHENGKADSSFSFLLRTAERLHVDLNDLITGESPRLSLYSLTRAVSGTPVKRRPDFEYLHLAPRMKNRLTEPFVVKAPAVPEDAPIKLSTHAGQEFDYILKGRLKVQIEGNIEYLSEGDSIYYDSAHRHGMVAVDGSECVFLAIVIKGNYREAELPVEAAEKEPSLKAMAPLDHDLIYKKYVHETFDEAGHLKDLEFNIPENFNFAYDVLDELAHKSPNRRAMRWISNDGIVRDFTFKDISEASSRTANYLVSLGIKKGDRVMAVLKRHYQFWYVINALHKIGALIVPAPAQLLKKDYEYRFNSAAISAVIASADGEITDHIDEALPESPTVKTKIIVNGTKKGWLSFDSAIEHFPAVFNRPEDLKATDPLAVFFSSGTSGYPKMIVHTHSYPLGHVVTARWWHNVDPNGLHLTIADTGWAKSVWGKLYGQWLCEAGVFVYDFDRFHAEKLLPLFKKHNITTFCAPPTIYRFFIKEDLSKYDLSSLKYVCTAGEALNPEVFQQFQAATGLKVMEAYGQTELTVLLGNFTGMTPKPGAMGKPNPQYQVELITADGHEAKTGETGEICVRHKTGDNVIGLFAGYYNLNGKPTEAWPDDLYHTGDIAWRDEDGYFWYVGRCDDLIKTSGYRVSPFEIESVIMELPYILECAITGVPDPIRGQIIKATIMLVHGKEGSEELVKEIQDYVKTHTAPYKYPRRIEFVKDLPKTISGKIRRSQIREEDSKRKD